MFFQWKLRGRYKDKYKFTKLLEITLLQFIRSNLEENKNYYAIPEMINRY